MGKWHMVVENKREEKSTLFSEGGVAQDKPEVISEREDSSNKLVQFKGQKWDSRLASGALTCGGRGVHAIKKGKKIFVL